MLLVILMIKDLELVRLLKKDERMPPLVAVLLGVRVVVEIVVFVGTCFDEIKVEASLEGAMVDLLCVMMVMYFYVFGG